MRQAIDGLLFGWRKNLDYGQRLVADLSDAQWIAQPSGLDRPANHAAWALSHLNAYLPVISAIVAGESIDDPKEHRFGMLSHPESDRSVYLPAAELVEEFVNGHEKVIGQLESCGDDVLSTPVSLARWSEIMPTAAIALPYLMLSHENTHLGQVSAWRRALNLPPV